MAAATGEMLVDLTNLTLANLPGSLTTLWATAQQINPRQMIDISTRCVFSTINKCTLEL